MSAVVFSDSGCCVELVSINQNSISNSRRFAINHIAQNQRVLNPLALSLPNAAVNSVPDGDSVTNAQFQHSEEFSRDLRLRYPNSLYRCQSDSAVQLMDASNSGFCSPPYLNFARYLPCLSTPPEISSVSSTLTTLSVSGSGETESDFRLPISASQLSLPEPPDGGWGWVIVFAAFLVHMITDGVIVSFGIFIEVLAEDFQESMSATSWVGSFSYGVPALVTPISSLFLDRFGCRTTCVVGALISAIGCLIGCFANSLLALIFTFGILTGLGFSLCMTAALVIVAMYFDEYRATATGLSIAGTGVGALIFAPAVEYFITIYTWRGTFMLMAGIVLHMVVCGVLMRPVETRTQRRHRQRLAWLEHFVKESGLPSLMKDTNYLDRDVLGRIKLLRDVLLAPRKCSGRTHAVVRFSEGYLRNQLNNQAIELTKPSCSVDNQNSNKCLDRIRPVPCAATNPVFMSTVKRFQPQEAPLGFDSSSTFCITQENRLLDQVIHGSDERPPGSPDRFIQSRIVSKSSPIVHLDSASINIAHLNSERWVRNNGFHGYPGSLPLRRLSSCIDLAQHTHDRKQGCHDPILSSLETNKLSQSFSKSVSHTIGGSEMCVNSSFCVSSEVGKIPINCSDTVQVHLRRSSLRTNTLSAIHTNSDYRNLLSTSAAQDVPLLTYIDPPDKEKRDTVEVFYRGSLLKAFGLTRASLCKALSLPDLSKVHRIRRRSGSDGSGSSSSEGNCAETTCCAWLLREESDEDEESSQNERLFTNWLTHCAISLPEVSLRQVCRRMCDLRLFRRPMFDMFLLSNALLYFWYNVTYFFMGVYAVDLGMSESQAALLFSILGGANMVGEIIVGLLADREWVNALMLYFLMLLICGVSTSLVPYFTSFTTLSLYAGVFGMGLASNDALCTILLVDFVGLHHLTNGLGICFFCQGVANIIGPPTIGFIIDSTGSQNVAYFVSGVGLVLSSLVVVPIIVQRFRRRRARRLRRKQAAATQEQHSLNFANGNALRI